MRLQTASYRQRVGPPALVQLRATPARVCIGRNAAWMGRQLEDEWILQRVDILELFFELLDRVEMFQQDSRVEPLDSAVHLPRQRALADA